MFDILIQNLLLKLQKIVLLNLNLVVVNKIYFDGFSYVSTSSFEQLKQLRRKRNMSNAKETN